MNFINGIKELFVYSKFQLTDWFDNKGSEDVKNLRKAGCFVKTDALREGVAEIIVAEIERALGAHEREVNIWRDDTSSDQRVYQFEKLFPEVISYLPVKDMQRLGEQYLGRQLKSYFVMAAKLDAKKNNKGSGGGWHRDSPFSHQFKFICYLSDVTEVNGPFQYIAESHTTKSKLNSPFPFNKMRYLESEVEQLNMSEALKTIQGSKGTLLGADTKGIHRGKPIESGCRYACTVYFFESDSIPSSFDKYLQK